MARRRVLWPDFDENNPQHLIRAMRRSADELEAALRRDPSRRSVMFWMLREELRDRLRYLALRVERFARYSDAARNQPMDLDEVMDAAELEWEVPPDED